MKKLYRLGAALLLCATLLPTLSGCESENQFGKCVGIAQGDRRDPDLTYDLSIWNTVWSIIGFETIVAPVVFLHHETYCPSGPRVGKPAVTQPATNFLGETK